MQRPLALALPLILALATGLGCDATRGAHLYRNGTRALEAGDTDAAVRDLEEAARRVPEASEVHNHLGLAYLAAGREGAARRAFQRAVALDCDNRAAAHNLQRLETPSRQP